MKFKARLILIVLVLTLLLSACFGDRRDAGEAVPPGTGIQPVGEEQIDEGINEFFQNPEPCPGIVC